MKKYMLKELLQDMKLNNYQLTSSIDISALTEAMLQEIGNIDPILRDSLIYNTFLNLIMKGKYSDTQLKRYLEICLDDKHLFYRLGEEDTDSVFTRSFSSLIIAAILHINVQKDFLITDELIKTTDLLLKYLEKEKDVRGYVSEKGWAHSIAHIADALAALSIQPALPVFAYNDIFHSIIDKMCYRKAAFNYEEDERMVIAVIALIDQGLHEDVVCERIKQISDDLQRKFLDSDISLLIYRSNIKQFFSSLYFHLEAKNKCKRIRYQIRQGMNMINHAYY